MVILSIKGTRTIIPDGSGRRRQYGIQKSRWSLCSPHRLSETIKITSILLEKAVIKFS